MSGDQVPKKEKKAKEESGNNASQTAEKRPLSPSESSSSLSSLSPASSSISRRDASSSVQVAVRVRPMLALEGGSDICMEVLRSAAAGAGKNDGISIGGSSGPRFTFDEVFDTGTVQADIYKRSVVPLVESCLEGYNATILAYGQTGSGKTHTMMGPNTSSAVQDDALAGVIPRALQAIFESLQKQQRAETGSSYESDSSNQSEVGGGGGGEYQVRIQFLELYGEEINDLLTSNSSTSLSSNKCTIRDLGTDEPEVVGATQQQVHSAEEALMCLTHGMLRRVTGATAMNNSSSRSHAILSVLVEQSVVTAPAATASGGTGTGTSECQQHQEQHVQVKRSKFNFVDLAGSERQKRTKAEGKRLKEGIDINKGLLALGNVISALGDPKKRGKAFVPYRDSKLTRLLKGSLGGNHKTLMIACVSPSFNNMDESLSCLRYANRAKNIQNNAIVNMDSTSRLLIDLQEKLSVLASELLRAWDGHPVGENNSSGKLTRDALQSMAAGGKSSSDVLLQSPTRKLMPPTPSPQADNRLKDVEAELSRTRVQLREVQNHHDSAEEQLYVTKAEKELCQLQLSVLSSDSGKTVSVDAKDTAFLEKAKQYEKEIGVLRESLRVAEEKANSLGRNSAIGDFDYEKEMKSLEQAKCALDEDRERLKDLKSSLPPAPESGLKTPATTSSPGKLDAEENEVEVLTKKYLAQSGENFDDENDEAVYESAGHGSLPVSPDPIERQKLIQADLVALSKTISSKENLIDQLKVSQEKYSNMRAFYEGRLKQMETVLQERESEREQLAEALSHAITSDQSNRKDLEDKLRRKDEHIASLKTKQKQLRNLTAVSSRNDAEIMRLQEEVKNMKYSKVELQKRVANVKKRHMNEVKQMKKESVQMDRELNKWKKISQKRELEVQKAQQVAKHRREEIGQLRTKYKDVEKRLRVASLKRGVMANAGLDPVITGRKNVSNARSKTGRKNSVAGSDDKIDSVRDYFDQKVAEVVRKEALVDKLAHEWEEHFELTAKREESNQAQGEGSDDSESLEWQIQFKEDQIRKLAQRIGKQKSQKHSNGTSPAGNSFLFDKEFEKLSITGTSNNPSKTTVEVLFGMVVRERRRIAALARTASSLDERALAAEKASETSAAALRAYMKESEREIESLSHNQQLHILSLMDMVKEDSSSGIDEDGTASVETSDPKLLVLANERISVLERQLQEFQSNKSVTDSYPSQLEDLRDSLSTKSQECSELDDQLRNLRSKVRDARDLISQRGPGHHATGDIAFSQEILNILSDTLHPNSPPRSAKQRKRKPSRSVRKHSAEESDSSEDFDEQGWETDIMADLALIAEGKLPPSLKGQSEMIESQLEKASVFDRLTDPTNFTGVQKHVLSTATKAPLSISPPERQSVPAGKDLHPKNDQVADQPTNHISPDKVEKESLIADSPLLQGPSANLEKGISVEETCVFDRLTNPENFTGVQKQVRTRIRGTEISRKKERKELSREIAATLEKIVIPGAENRMNHNDEEIVSGNHGDDLSNQEQCKSVFDRLTSPSHFTGTQKERLKEHTTQKKKKKTSSRDEKKEENIDYLLSDLLASENGVSPGAENRMNHNDEEIVSENHGDDLSNQKQCKSVFDRLTSPSHFTGTQKERLKEHTTQKKKKKASSRDEKKEENVDYLLSDLLASENGSAHESDEDSPDNQRDKKQPVRKTLTEYTQKNVFERLQRTTTRSYAVKHDGATFLETAHSEPEISARQESSEETSQRQYTSQDVFQRLQQTTTEAYAKKTQRIKHEGNTEEL